jgi:DNA-binding NtrC family response regulator
VVQQALLQLVEERMVHRMGSARHIPMDVRLVFATNDNLEAAVASGPFRHDLYFRLGKLLVRFPPLVEHLEDVPELVPVLLRRLAAEASVPIPTVSPGALGLLTSYPWPGNVRELQAALQHYVAFGDLPDDVVRWARHERWRDRISEALEQCRGNKTAAADLLGIRRQTLHKELRRRRPQRAS